MTVVSFPAPATHPHMMTVPSSRFPGCGHPVQDEPVFPKLLQVLADIPGPGSFVRALVCLKGLLS